MHELFLLLLLCRSSSLFPISFLYRWIEGLDRQLLNCAQFFVRLRSVKPVSEPQLVMTVKFDQKITFDPVCCVIRRHCLSLKNAPGKITSLFQNFSARASEAGFVVMVIIHPSSSLGSMFVRTLPVPPLFLNLLLR